MFKIMVFASIFAAASQTAGYAEESRLTQLAECLSFAYVNSDLDGTRDISPDLVPGLQALKDEFLFEGSIVGLDDDAAHSMIVAELSKQNMINLEKGKEALRAIYLDGCRELARGIGNAS